MNNNKLLDLEAQLRPHCANRLIWLLQKKGGGAWPTFHEPQPLWPPLTTKGGTPGLRRVGKL